MSYIERWINWVKQRKNKENGTAVTDAGLKNKEDAMIDNDCAIINSTDVDREIVRLEKNVVALRNLRKAYPGTRGMWLEGVSFIRDSFFVHYAKTIAADTSDMNVWPLQYINWVDAIKAFKIKHVSIDFAGVKYWVKKPI